jgi:glycosyltransferase involved in cell wall biosynthesis
MKKTSPGSHSENPYNVVGVCTDMNRENSGGKYGAISWYRIINPLKKLGAKIKFDLRLYETPEWALEFAKEGKIWFMKMTDNEGIDFTVGLARDFTGSKYVLDLDDDPYSFSKNHPEYQKLKERMPQVKKIIQLADHVVVSTQGIKDVISKDNPYVTVIPNTIDPAIWKFKNKKRDDGKIHIGWIASASHMADLHVILEALNEIVKKYDNVHIHFAGMIDMKIVDVENPTDDMINLAVLKSLVEHSKLKTNFTPLVGRFSHHVGTQGYEEFPEFLASLGLDIAVAAIENTQFNRCKSNIKWLEHAMLEIPMVLSDVGPYRESVKHGETGFLAKTKDDWMKYLSMLIEDAELRKKIGVQAKQSALEGFHIKDQLPKYQELFTKLIEKKDITVVTAIAGGKDKLKDQKEYKGVEYVAFVDEKTKSSFWKTRPVCDKFKKPVMNAKIHKVLTHKYVETPYIVWIDGNMDLKVDPHKLVDLLGEHDFAFFKHPGRDCVYEEADMCVQLKKGSMKELAEQTKQYAKDGFEPHSGLCEMTAFVRRNTPEANEAFERWWAEICRHSERDQVSFPVAFQREEWATIPGSVAVDEHPNFPGNAYFTLNLHKK